MNIRTALIIADLTGISTTAINPKKIVSRIDSPSGLVFRRLFTSSSHDVMCASSKSNKVTRRWPKVVRSIHSPRSQTLLQIIVLEWEGHTTMLEVIDWLTETAKQFVASNLSATLITAAFGAFAGAFLAGRVQHKRTIVAELNGIKAAMALCFAMCKTFLSQKQEIIRPLYERYKQAQQYYDEHKNGSPLPARALLDLQTITPMKVSIELLERHVFEKISIQGRALVVMADLVAVIDSLDKSFKFRNDLIEKYEKTNFSSDKEKIETYLGRQTSNRTIDDRFRGNMEHMRTQIDNCIFFSRILADDLLEYGTKLRNRNKWKYRLGIRKLERADWSIAEKGGLIPSNELFADWLKMFKKPETKWSRLKARIRSDK
jgi:hypothetical protein